MITNKDELSLSEINEINTELKTKVAKMTLETNLLKHLREWKYEGDNSTYQYSNAYEYIKDVRMNAMWKLSCHLWVDF